MSSIFSKIIAGEIPSYKVYEDELVFAFLDINPVQPGHVLVVPKVEIDQFVDVNDGYYLAVFKAAKIIAKAQKKALNCHRVCTLIEGYEVPHFHYHLIPTNTAEDFHAPRTTLEADRMKTIAQSISDNI